MVSTVSKSFVDFQLINVAFNQCSIAFLKGIVKGMTAVIFGYGSSLHDSINWKKENRDNLVIFRIISGEASYIPESTYYQMPSLIESTLSGKNYLVDSRLPNIRCMMVKCPIIAKCK